MLGSCCQADLQWPLPEPEGVRGGRHEDTTQIAQLWATTSTRQPGHTKIVPTTKGTPLHLGFNPRTSWPLGRLCSHPTGANPAQSRVWL